MSVLASLLPILLSVGLIAAFAKLAALLYRRVSLAWKHAAVYSVALLLVSTAMGLTHKALGNPLPTALLLGLSLTIQALMGGGYFGPRARYQSGEAIRFRGGAILAIATIGVAVVVLVLPALAYFAFQGASAA